MVSRNLNKYDLISKVIDVYHSSIDKRQVIGLVLDILEKEISPVDMFIYGENSSLIGIPMKNLLNTAHFKSEKEILLNGHVRILESCTYFPLRGIECVYGLIKVESRLDRETLDFVECLIKVVSSSIENIYLKLESKRLIDDLHSINRISYGLSEKTNITDVIRYVSNNLKDLLNADEVKLYLKKECNLNVNSTLKCESGYFEDFSINIVENLPNLEETDNFYKSFICSPLIMNHKIIGYCEVFSKIPNAFKSEHIRLLESISHYTSIVLYNVSMLENLQDRVIKDDLTKLHNRAYLEAKINYSLLSDEKGAFLLIDIDDFKKVNDTLGHKVGDQILVQVASIIKDSIKDTDVAARWGGEELVVYLPNACRTLIEQVANSIVKNVPIYTNPCVTVSCGISHWEGSGVDYKEVFLTSDSALYEAKRSGKNKYILSDLIEGK